MRKTAVVAGAVVIIAAAVVAGALLAHYHWKQPAPAAKAPSATSSLKPCTAASLTGSLNAAVGGGTAGSIYMDLVLQNSGSTSCTVQGFPKLQLIDTDGNSVGTAAKQDTSNSDGALMTLAPTGTTRSVVRFVANNYPAGTCKQGATTLRVTPPNDTTTLNIPTSVDTWCPGFSVSALAQNN